MRQYQELGLTGTMNVIAESNEGLMRMFGMKADAKYRLLEPVERLGKPGPRNERARDRLEHCNDCHTTRAQMPERAHEQEERHDRPEGDHPAGQ